MEAHPKAHSIIKSIGGDLYYKRMPIDEILPKVINIRQPSESSPKTLKEFEEIAG